MSNTYEYEGKVYHIVPDGDEWPAPPTSCRRCAFYKDLLACKAQPVGSDGDAYCVMGKHHYVLDEEQA